MCPGKYSCGVINLLPSSTVSSVQCDMARTPETAQCNVLKAGQPHMCSGVAELE